MNEETNKQIDIRWVQRFQNFKRALAQLERFMQQTSLNELEQQGLIQSFEYNHELAWKVQKDFLEAQGVTELFGSKNVAREAFKLGLIEDGDVWLSMISSRKLTSHTYNEAVTSDIIGKIENQYYYALCQLKVRLNALLPDQTTGS